MADDMSPERLRASDVDRKAVADRLNRAHDDGMLSLSEFDVRVGAAWQAVTRGELAELTADLPEPSGPPTPAPAPQPRPKPPAVRRRTPTALRVLNTIWASILAVNVVVWLLVCLTNGELIYPWFLWVLVPGVALAVIGWNVRRHRPGT